MWRGRENVAGEEDEEVVAQGEQEHRDAFGVRGVNVQDHLNLDLIYL